MPFVTSVSLTTLHDIEDRRERASEPFIWPYMAGIGFGPGTFETDPQFAFLSTSRDIIKSGMKAGESAQLDYPGNFVSLTFEDGQHDCSVMLVTTLLEADENYTDQMMHGFQAYIDEMRVQLGHKLLSLIFETDQSEYDLLVDGIKSAAIAKAKQAIKDHMTTGQKVADFFGTYDRDDFIDTDFRLYRKIDKIIPFERNLTIELMGTDGESGRHYHLDGRLSVVRLEVDPCQGKVDALRAAQSALDGYYGQREALQAKLQHASPNQKADIVDAIEALDPQIANAEAAVQRARMALRRCRLTGPLNNPVDRSPAITPIITVPA